MTDTPHIPPDSEVKVFGKRKKKVTFRIEPGDELFTAAPKIPADAMIGLVDRFQEIKTTSAEGGKNIHQSVDVAMEMFRTVLYPESFELLQHRMKDQENPIDVHDLIEVMQWLMGEAYGLRPTVRSQNSAAGSETPSDGQLSTENAPAEDSTPLISTGDDSSTSSTSTSLEELMKRNEQNLTDSSTSEPPSSPSEPSPPNQ